MKQVVVSIFDSATGTYSRPAFVASAGAAVRSFMDEVNRKDDGNVMNKHPADFTLIKLATWDDNTGEFVFELEPLMRAKDVVGEQ